MSDNADMIKLIADLRAENAVLKNKNEEKVIKINQIKTIYPPDYETNKELLRQMKKRCTKLQRIIEIGNISSLQSLIQQYISYSKLQLKKISVEIKLNEYGLAENTQIKDFINYLDFISDELQKFLRLTEQGKFIEQPRLNNCKREINNTIKLLQKINVTKFQDEQSQELCDSLLLFGKNIKEIYDSCDAK